MTQKRFKTLSIEEKISYLTNVAIELKVLTGNAYADSMYKINNSYVHFQYKFSGKYQEEIRPPGNTLINSYRLKRSSIVVQIVLN
jgi:hypothetical protein